MRRVLRPAAVFFRFALVVTTLSSFGFAARASARGGGAGSLSVRSSLIFSAHKLSFGKNVSIPVTKQFTVTAENEAFNVNVDPPSGTGASSYSIVSGAGSFVLQPGVVATVTVIFDPQSAGTFPRRFRSSIAC
jgi:hypothetical protein